MKNPSGAPTREGSKDRTCGRFGQKTPPEMARAKPISADAPSAEILMFVVTSVIIFRSRCRSFAPEMCDSGKGRGFYVAPDPTSSAAKWTPTLAAKVASRSGDAAVEETFRNHISIQMPNALFAKQP